MGIPRQDWDDRVVVEPGGPDGYRYFRADDPARREYTYRHPFILEVELTRRCNLACRHCYARSGPDVRAPEPSAARLAGLFDEAARQGFQELSLTGGEVLARADFLEILDAGLEAGLGVRFVTNGTLVTQGLAACLAERPVRLVTVSLDAIRPEVQDQIRGPGSHERAMRGILTLAEAGLRVSIITAFSRTNLGEFDALFDFCERNGFDWQVQTTSAKGRCPATEVLSPEEFYELGGRAAQAMAEARRINVVPMDDLVMPSLVEPHRILSQVWQGRCTGGILNLFVRADGAVTPCSALAADEFVVGHAWTEGLGPICEEERCRRALDWLGPDKLTGRCASCALKERCWGGCPDILVNMCRTRTENEYCFYRIETQDLLEAALEPETPE